MQISIGDDDYDSDASLCSEVQELDMDSNWRVIHIRL